MLSESWVRRACMTGYLVQNRRLLFLADEVGDVVGCRRERIYPPALQRRREIDRTRGIHGIRAFSLFLERAVLVGSEAVLPPLFSWAEHGLEQCGRMDDGWIEGPAAGRERHREIGEGLTGLAGSGPVHGPSATNRQTRPGQPTPESETKEPRVAHLFQTKPGTGFNMFNFQTARGALAARLGAWLFIGREFWDVPVYRINLCFCALFWTHPGVGCDAAGDRRRNANWRQVSFCSRWTGQAAGSSESQKHKTPARTQLKGNGC